MPTGNNVKIVILRYSFNRCNPIKNVCNVMLRNISLKHPAE